MKLPDYIMQTDNPTHVLPFKYSIWLTMSSLSFLIPSMLSFKLNVLSLFVLYFVTSIASANYWRKASYGLRRNIDLTVSRICFTLTLTTGIMHVRGFLRNIGWALVIAVALSYKLSFYLHDKKSFKWLIVHVFMHACTASGMCIVVIAVG